MVAGSGIEPLTSGLWVPRSNQLSYPALTIWYWVGTKLKNLSYQNNITTYKTILYKIKSYYWVLFERNCFNSKVVATYTSHLKSCYYELYERKKTINQNAISWVLCSSTYLCCSNFCMSLFYCSTFLSAH